MRTSMRALRQMFVYMSAMAILIGIVEPSCGLAQSRPSGPPALPSSDIPCAANESRLFVSSADRAGKSFVNVYCGKDTKPVAALSVGIRGAIAGISSDGAGNVYVSEASPQGTNTAGALIAYDPHGRFLARVGGLENSAGSFVDRNDRTVYAVTPHYEDSPPARWKNKFGWIPHLTAIAGNPPSVRRSIDPPSAVAARFFLVDEPGYIYLWDNSNGHIDKMNAKTGKIVESVFAPAGAMALAPDHKIFANGYGTIRVLDLKTFKIVRTFHDGSVNSRDDGPIAVGRDGTLFVVHKQSATIEQFAPGASRATAVIRNVGVVGEIAVDSDGTVIAAVRGSGEGQTDIPAGVYAFQAGTVRPLRMYSDSAGGPLGAVSSFTLVLGPGR